MKRAENFPQDNVDDVPLPHELQQAIEVFANESARFFDLRHHVDIPHEEEIRVAVERVMRLLLDGEDADSIRSMTQSPWPPTR